MSARNLAPIRTLVRELIPIVGSFAPNGSSAISGASRKGLGFTVAYTSTGLYTVTLSDKYADIVAVTHNVALVTAADIKLQTGVVTQSSASAAASVQIRSLAVATLTDIAANAANRISFVIWVRNSAALPTYGA